MKKSNLKKLKDGAKFKLSQRKTAAIYELNRKSKGLATFTSVRSGRSFERKESTVVYPV